MVPIRQGLKEGIMRLKLVKDTGKKLELNQEYKEKIRSIFKLPRRIRAQLYEKITFSEILSFPFKRTLDNGYARLTPQQKSVLTRSGYHDLILDYLTLRALTEKEKQYFFEDLNNGKIPYFLKFNKVAQGLEKMKTPITPFTVKEVNVKYIDIDGEKIRQEIVKTEKICLTEKGLTLLARLCPKLKIFKPVIIG